jgi:lysophospholipase L1-like esterase
MAIDRSRLLTALAATLVTAVALEGGFRLVEGRLGVDRDRLQRFRALVTHGGETALYEPRPHVLYARPRGRDGINSLGFNDDEFPRNKRPALVRIACLGSSTTEGGNPDGREGSYPYFLHRILEQKGRAVEVMNFGMSGWTSAEILVNYVLTVQDFAPDVVVIHEAANDVEPRNWPGFRSDYSHYRKPWTEPQHSFPYRLLVRVSDVAAALAMRRTEAFGLQAVVVRPPDGPFTFADGRLPPETATAFRRNIRTIAEHARLRGARVVLATMPYDAARAAALPVYRSGIDEHNQILRDLAQEGGFVLVDLAALAQRSPEGLRPHFLDLVHVDAEGNRWKAEAIAGALEAQALWAKRG